MAIQSVPKGKSLWVRVCKDIRPCVIQRHIDIVEIIYKKKNWSIVRMYKEYDIIEE